MIDVSIARKAIDSRRPHCDRTTTTSNAIEDRGTWVVLGEVGSSLVSVVEVVEEHNTVSRCWGETVGDVDSSREQRRVELVVAVNVGYGVMIGEV